MSQLSVNTAAIPVVVMTPNEIRALFMEIARETQTASTVPTEARELEILKRKALLTPDEVQKLYGLNSGTLRNKRGAGTGPEYIQEDKGCDVYYEHSAIQTYLAKCRKKTHE